LITLSPFDLFPRIARHNKKKSVIKSCRKKDWILTDKRNISLVIFWERIVLFILLSFFFWSLYCLSFCPFSFGYCIVYPFVLFLLVIVLFILLSFFFWLLYCLSFFIWLLDFNLITRIHYWLGHKQQSLNLNICLQIKYWLPCHPSIFSPGLRDTTKRNPSVIKCGFVFLNL
jgi:hypothetical protein